MDLEGSYKYEIYKVFSEPKTVEHPMTRTQEISHMLRFQETMTCA